MDRVGVCELRAAVMSEVGGRLDDSREVAVGENKQFEGAVAALAHTERQVEALCKDVDREIDDGRLDLEQAALAKKWIARAAGVVFSNRTMADNRRLMAAGKVAALDVELKVLKQRVEAERARMSMVQAAAASGMADPVVEGQPAVEGRAHVPLRIRRLAEEAREQAAAAVAAVAEAVGQQPVVEATPGAQEPAQDVASGASPSVAPQEQDPPRKRASRRRKVAPVAEVS